MMLTEVFKILSYLEFTTAIRPLSVYSMGNESSDEMKMCPMRKKNIWGFILFFSCNTLKREYKIFSQSGSFSAPEQPKFSKYLQQEKTSDSWILKKNFFQQGTKTFVGIRRP